ncbi:hypothetical protein BJX99DRAFT_255851 [Aspergillus californicus]
MARRVQATSTSRVYESPQILARFKRPIDIQKIPTKHLTSTISTPELSVTLQSTQSELHYVPGDIITGTVSRTAVGALSETKVSVTIYGNARAQVLFSRPGKLIAQTSSFNAFSAPIETRILHSDAPLHVSEGGACASWPFALAIPALGSDIRSPRRTRNFWPPSGADEDGRFPPPGSLYLEPDDTHWHEPCGGCKSESSYEGYQGKGFVEYYVQAEIEISSECNGQPVKRTYTATAPFLLRDVRLGPPITDFGTTTHYAGRCSVIAYGLIPGINLRLRRKRAQLPSSAPTLAFQVTFSMPTTLQVGNTARIPLSLIIKPVYEETSEILHRKPQELTIKSFKLWLTPITTFRTEDQKREQYGRRIPLVGPEPLAPVRVTITPTLLGSGGSARVDIGELLDIRLTQDVHPCFSTYNISRSHRLIAQIDGVVAGEIFMAKSTPPWDSPGVTVLPQAYEGRPRSVASQETGEALPEYMGRDEVLPGYDD